MSQLITISNVTANTPVDIYYCDSMSANCQVVTTSQSNFPYSFTVPDNFSSVDFFIKIIDSSLCEVGEIIHITPTPTTSITPTITPTITQTSTETPTPTVTPTYTPTISLTTTITPTITVTVTPTKTVSTHRISFQFRDTAEQSCSDNLSIYRYYTYIYESDSIPVIGAKVYQTKVGIELHNPLVGNNKFIKMEFGGTQYSVQINNIGEIINYINC